jgi:plasmid stabilization system protein ParE
MSLRVQVARAAKRDIRQIVAWWSEHRSTEQALRWFARIGPAIDTLGELADRCPISPESDLLPTGLRQLHFGLGRKATHRIVFTIVGEEVRVLRIRHAAQQSLTLEDLSICPDDPGVIEVGRGLPYTAGFRSGTGAGALVSGGWILSSAG